MNRAHFAGFSAADHWEVAAVIERIAANHGTAKVAVALMAFAESERKVARGMGHKLPSEIREAQRERNRKAEAVIGW